MGWSLLKVNIPENISFSQKMNLWNVTEITGSIFSQLQTIMTTILGSYYMYWSYHMYCLIFFSAWIHYTYWTISMKIHRTDFCTAFPIKRTLRSLLNKLAPLTVLNTIKWASSFNRDLRVLLEKFTSIYKYTYWLI